MIDVLHVLQHHSRGGASRSAMTLARRSAREGRSRHRILSLTPPEPAAVAAARADGVDVLAAPDARALARAIDAADVVQVHYWNTPELAAFMRGATPPMRSVLWCDVAGDTAPHVLTPELAGWPDALVASCRYTASLPVWNAGEDRARPAHRQVILGVADFDRLGDVRPEPHEGFHVGYVGTVEFSKMDPGYVAMHAAIDVPGLRCLVYGSGHAFGALAAEAAAAGVADRFEFGGYVEDVARVFARLDVFGYPLAEGTYAAAELVLQEAMYAGVPPVVFRRGGVQRMVEHGQTGLVVESAREYVEAIEYLYRHPAERQRLAAAAAEFARREFSLTRAVDDCAALYARLVEQPRRVHAWPAVPRHVPDATGGAALFVEMLDGHHPEFQASLSAERIEDALAAEAAIRRAPPALVSASAGGVLHYRRVHPSDPHLRLWAGLVLLAAGRPALAAAEFRAAERALPRAPWRAAWYLADAAHAAGADELARDALDRVLDAAPTFAPARRLRERAWERGA